MGNLRQMSVQGAANLQEVRELPIRLPLAHAAKLDQLFREVALQLPKGLKYEIQVKGGEVVVAAEQAGIASYKLPDISKVTGMTQTDKTIELDINCAGFSKLTILTEPTPAPRRRPTPSLSSLGESRSGFSSRASG